MLYWILKNSIHFGLYCYHRKIEVHGLENVPKNKPVLFLPNHQNALIDVLLVGADCNRTPYFLARSDVFGRRVLNALFNYVKMIPIYRIRDGRNTLSKNDAVFDSCANVLSKGGAVVMFPEGNHNLKRRVRPLSKGFTRVLFRALERYPNLDVQLVPVGFNYAQAENFPDSVAVYYGTPISAHALFDKDDLPMSVLKIKDAVATQLKTLTTHISPDVKYEEINNYLKSKKVDFLNPEENNRLIREESFYLASDKEEPQKAKKGYFLQMMFYFLNLPVLLSWRLLIRPKVPEAEFMSTFRFAASFFGFFLYFILIFSVFVSVLNFWWAMGAVTFLWIFNWFYVKKSRLV